MAQTVTPQEYSLDFGKQRWPHHNDTPVTKKITYRNAGTADITLDLTVAAHGPGAGPVPAGVFALGSNQVVVPAGGTASVDLTANTQLGVDDGHYSASVLASGGGQTVRSTAVIEREVESYDITFRHIGRDGKPSEHFRSRLISLTSRDSAPRFVDSSAGDLTVRLAKGEYVLDSSAPVDARNAARGIDVLVQPKLSVDKAQTVTLDARRTKPVKLTVPDAKATIAAGMMEYNQTSSNGRNVGGYYTMDTFSTFNIAHLGPQITDGTLNQIWVGNWRKNSRTEYNAASGGAVQQIATGYTRDFKAAEFATVKVGVGASAKDKRATVEPAASIPGGHWGMSGFGAAQPTPTTRTMYVSTGDKAKWNFYVDQVASADPNGGYRTDLLMNSPLRSYRAGKIHQETFNTAVIGPALDQRSGFHRYGGQLLAVVPLFSDSRGNSATSTIESATTTLYRNGRKIGENADALTGWELLPIGREAGEFKLTTSVLRSAATARVSSRVDADWTFRAEAAPTDGQVTLPISTVRFSGAQVGLDSTARAGVTQTMSLQLHGAAANGKVKSLTAHASYDGGKTWRKLTVVKNTVAVKNPAKGRAISLRAQVTDKEGGSNQVTVHNAFFGK